MTRECQVGTQIRVQCVWPSVHGKPTHQAPALRECPLASQFAATGAARGSAGAEVHCTTSASNRNVFSCLLSIRSATLCCVELDGSTPLDLWWLRNITNWRNHS
jgi:hypothetical protein